MNNLQQLPDNELVKLYENGCNEAFKTLLLRYKKNVYSYIFLIVKNRELTEDIFQDTFIKAIATIQRGKYVDSGKFLGWINRIAHNIIIDNFRKQKNENTVSTESFDYDVINSTKLTELNIEDNISNEQVLTDIAYLVDLLPVKQQRVIKMRYYENMSFKEIAELTGVSINTALGRMRYALQNLRKIALEKEVCLELK